MLHRHRYITYRHAQYRDFTDSPASGRDPGRRSARTIEVGRDRFVPVKTTKDGYEVVKTYQMDEFSKGKLAATNEELVGERDTVKELLPA